MACTEKGCAAAQVACVAKQCAIQPVKPACAVTPVGKLCIRGKVAAGGELIEEGAPIQVQIYPKGCFSSSCTTVDKAECSLTPGNVTTFVQAEFCLATNTGPGGCTADCSGGSSAHCSGGTWSKGKWPVSAPGGNSALWLEVDVPSQVPFGGLCVGSQF